MKRIKRILGIIGVGIGVPILITVILSACGGSSDDGGNGEATSVMDREADISVSAIRLYQKYDQNEVAADEKYKGKILEVSGVVDEVGTDILDKVYVALKTTTGKYNVISVQCYFPESRKNQAGQLSSGQQVSINGKCEGKPAINVELKDCFVVQ